MARKKGKSGKPSKKSTSRGATRKAPTRAPARKRPTAASRPAPARDNGILREQLVRLLRGDGAHLSYVQALSDFPARWANERVPGVPHTPWQLLEHARIAQRDMMEFSRDPVHESPAFPEGYWPTLTETPSAEAWGDSLAAFLDDLDTFIRWVSGPRTDLLTDLHDGEGPPLLREAFLIADHNAYHLGQIVQIRRALEAKG